MEKVNILSMRRPGVVCRSPRRLSDCQTANYRIWGRKGMFAFGTEWALLRRGNPQSSHASGFADVLRHSPAAYT